MYRAAEKGERYLSLMTSASCQAFYDEMADSYDIPRFNLFEQFTPDDLKKAAQDFDRVMEGYRTLYDKTDAAVCRYEDIEAFISDYLR